MAAICGIVRSEDTFSVLAPSPTSTCAVAGFVTGKDADSFACMSAGSAPAARIASNADSSPRSAISTLRMPWSAARAMSSRPRTIWSWPQDAAASIWPAGAREVAEASQPAFGRANSDTSTLAARAVAAMSSSSASVSMYTPLPCETRWTGTPSGAPAASTARRQSGPSVLGISIR